MPLTYRYVPYHKGDNEWLAEPANCNEEGWDEAWALLKGDCPHHIHITEEIYNNQEYGEIPDWIEITIQDEYLLQYKMARGIIRSLENAQGIVYMRGFDIDISPEWGGWGFKKLEITDSGGYVTIGAKHSAGEEIEVDVSEQLTHALGG